MEIIACIDQHTFFNWKGNDNNDQIVEHSHLGEKREEDGRHDWIILSQKIWNTDIYIMGRNWESSRTNGGVDFDFCKISFSLF